ncbi:hypothetical protein [Microvirga makkahensis]|uniref:Uncharacterized protein n=1 Tax=Microvirga makkahensis TaxID=1128670 RepID=A0A7X3MN06_9HYPH|nr:hypothetical protein [Microvirga makkahensis]MXQ10077.1 hypothetical protein [Microvirga makkahensis]
MKKEINSATAESTAAQVRSRITDYFQPSTVCFDQDNFPLRSWRSTAVHSEHSHSRRRPTGTPDRTAQLALLHQTLETIHHNAAASIQQNAQPAHAELLLERQQLVLKNEFTEGFGRIEIWFVSTTVFTLVLLSAIELLWAFPILALSIGRSWHLDRQCRKRRTRISEIDAIARPTVRISHA